MFVRGKPTNAFFKIDKLCNNIEVLKKLKFHKNPSAIEIKTMHMISGKWFVFRQYLV